jgi:hypothetical protein
MSSELLLQKLHGNAAARASIALGQRIHQISHGSALGILVASIDRRLDTAFDMAAHHFTFHPHQGSARRLDLCHNIHAVAVFFQHFLYAPHLSFDAAQAGQQKGGVWMGMGHDGFLTQFGRVSSFGCKAQVRH